MLAKCKFQELKKVLCDREISLKTRAHFLQTFVRSRLLYAVQCWDCKEGEIKQLEACWHGFLRRMINNGFKRKDPAPKELENYAFVYTNNDLVRMTGTMPLRRFIKEQQLKYTAHICRLPNTDMRKRVLFAEGHKFSRTIWKRFETLLNTDEMQIRRTMMDRTKIRDLLDLL